MSVANNIAGYLFKYAFGGDIKHHLWLLDIKLAASLRGEKKSSGKKEQLLVILWLSKMASSGSQQSCSVNTGMDKQALLAVLKFLQQNNLHVRMLVIFWRV